MRQIELFFFSAVTTLLPSEDLLRLVLGVEALGRILVRQQVILLVLGHPFELVNLFPFAPGAPKTARDDDGRIEFSRQVNPRNRKENTHREKKYTQTHTETDQFFVQIASFDLGREVCSQNQFNSIPDRALRNLPAQELAAASCFHRFTETSELEARRFNVRKVVDDRERDRSVL